MIGPDEISVLLRLILSHLLFHFIVQPSAWISERRKSKYRSGKLYFHSLLSAFAAYLSAGLWDKPSIPLIIFTCYSFIGLWKSYQPEKIKYFVIEQILYFAVIFLLWMGIFNKWENSAIFLTRLYSDNNFLAVLAGYVIVIWPLGILIGIATERWRNEPGVNTDGLARAGMWIGFFERFLIFTFILIDQYTAIGFLIAAKSVLRFNDKENSTQKKTEYVLIGTLMSFSASLVLGLFLKYIREII
ncbi:MAG: DUF3307 domain-containing protein [Daejeonella sp.]